MSSLNETIKVDTAGQAGGDVAPAPAAGSQLAGTPIHGGKRFKKGSKAAKDFMAKLRAMRTKKGGKRGKRSSKKALKMDGGAPCPTDATLDESDPAYVAGEALPEKTDCSLEGNKGLPECQTGGRKRRCKSAKKTKGGKKRHSSKKHHKKGKKFLLW